MVLAIDYLMQVTDSTRTRQFDTRIDSYSTNLPLDHSLSWTLYHCTTKLRQFLQLKFLIKNVSTGKTVVYTIVTVFFTLVLLLSFSLSQHCCDIRYFNCSATNLITKLQHHHKSYLDNKLLIFCSIKMILFLAK